MTMSVKRGTTNTAATKQEQNFKADVGNTADAAEFKKAFGDQKLGDIANRMSDKNWVDPSKKMRTAGNPNLDKDAFFKMMLAQMKNQDPTKPLESHEMAAQLAQFSSVEQLNNIHDEIGKMAKAQAPNSSYQALALIGKTVGGDSSKVSRVAGDTIHDFNFELMNESQKTELTIRDMAGNIVKKMDLGALKKGANSVSWNGIGDDGLSARPGDYHFAIEAKAQNGAKIFAKTAFEGRITGMNFTPEGPVLLVGKQTLRLSDIKKIEESAAEPAAIPLGAQGPAARAGMPPGIQGLPPALEHLTRQLPNGMSLTPPNTAAKQKEFIPPAQEPIPQRVANIEDVPMSQGLLNQIEKETR